MKKSILRQIIREEIQRLNESQTDIMKINPKEQKKIIAQYEALRRRGQYNMLSFYEVQRAAFENGFDEFVNFTQNNSRAYGSILKNYGKLIKLIDIKKIPKAKKIKTSYSV